MNVTVKNLLWNCSRQIFMGCKISQYRVDLALWEYFFNHYWHIRSIIELGTEECGLSLFLALQAHQHGMEFRTFDRYRSDNLDTPLARLLKLEDRFVLGDLFGEAGTVLVDLLTGGLPRPVLLFCDDGDKPREVREFVPHLRAGDIVGVHDWGSEIGQEDVTIFGDALEPLWWDEWEKAGSITRFLKVVKEP